MPSISDVSITATRPVSPDSPDDFVVLIGKSQSYEGVFDGLMSDNKVVLNLFGN